MPPWKKSFFAIIAAEMLAIAGFGTSTPILPFFLQDLGVRDPAALKFWVGVINSSSSLSLAVMAPIWGRLADSYGRRSMLLRSMFGGGLVIFLIGFARSPSLVLTLRILQGAVTGTVAAATVMVAGLVPEEEVGHRMGLLQTAIFIGNSLGPFLGGYMADALGNRFTFFATSLMLIAAGFIVRSFVTETFLPLRPERFRLRDLVPDFPILRENRRILVLIVLAALIQAGNSVVVPVLPLHIQNIARTGAKVGSISGLIIGAGAFASAVSAASMGRFAFRVGYGKLLFFGFAAASALHLPQGVAGDPWSILLFRILSSLALGMTVPAINALIAVTAAKEKQGSIYGLSSAMNAVGMAAGPVIGSAVALVAGYRAVFFASAAILGFSARLTRRGFSSADGGATPIT